MTQSLPTLVNRPSMVEYKHYRFLIMDAPTDTNLPAYIEVLKKKHVVCVVRACEPTYNKEPLIAAGIRVLEVAFDDGDPPPEHMLNQWLSLVRSEFGAVKGGGGGDDAKDKDKEKNGNGKGGKTSATAAAAAAAEVSTASTPSSASGSLGDDLDKVDAPNKKTIAVHCVAGLGRAPVLVAVALIEAGMKPFDAIAFIRKRRRGAINARQLKFIEGYKSRSKLRDDAGCVIC